MIDPTGIEPVGRRRGRRAFVAALAGGLLCAPQVAKAQQGERIASVGILYFGPSLSLEEQERRATVGSFLADDERAWLGLRQERRCGAHVRSDA